jgi:hypothetical protein
LIHGKRTEGGENIFPAPPYPRIYFKII